MPKVAIVIPGSPNAGFYSQIAALNLAVKSLPWTNWEPAIHVSMGPQLPGGTALDAFERWRPYLREVQFTYVPESQYENEGNWAQVDASLLVAPRDADAYISLDADTFPVSSLEGLLSEICRENAIGGVMAHFGPPTINEIGGWAGLARAIGVPPLDMTQVYSLLSEDIPIQDRVAPMYFNGGVLFFSKTSFDAFVPQYFALRSRIAETFHQSKDFSGQLAMAFALRSCGAKVRALPMRYNYPNDDRALALHPGELSQVVVYHFLRTQEFDRSRIFASAGAYHEFCVKKMSGANASFRWHVINALGNAYPFPAAHG